MEVDRFASRLFRNPNRKYIAIGFSCADYFKLFLRSLFGKYYIYSISIDGNSAVANVFIKHNYLNKYGFMKKNDMLINPYWTSESYRRRGYARQVLCYMFSDDTVHWENMYAVVENNNLPSIRALVSVGMTFVGVCEKKIWTYHLLPEQTEGRLLVFRYTRNSISR